jgi:hypothetical protein
MNCFCALVECGPGRLKRLEFCDRHKEIGTRLSGLRLQDPIIHRALLLVEQEKIDLFHGLYLAVTGYLASIEYLQKRVIELASKAPMFLDINEGKGVPK